LIKRVRQEEEEAEDDERKVRNVKGVSRQRARGSRAWAASFLPETCHVAASVMPVREDDGRKTCEESSADKSKRS